jgi:hypothetical protein
MTHLAKDFGISDAALHKICKKHEIPKPPAGWWTRKAMGQVLSSPPCPPAKAGTSDRISIAAGVAERVPAFAAAAGERARAIAAGHVEPDVMTPHPIVERTLAKLRQSKPLGLGTVTAGAGGLIKVSVAPASVERLGDILNRFVAAVAVQGFKLVAGESHAHFSDGTDTIEFSVSEMTDRKKYVLTDAEKAKEAAWLVRRERAMKVDPWRTLEYERPKFPEWNYQLNGKLSFELERVYVWGGDSPRRSFRDAKVQRLEKMAGDVGIALAVLAAAKVAERERRAIEQQRFDEARRLREVAARAKHVEERRAAALGAILSEVQELERLRAQLALVAREAEINPTPRIATFLAWSREQLAAREARLSPSGLEKRFEEERLFGETDDVGFRPSLY